MAMSWQQLNALAAAHRRKQADEILMLMVAAQGDNDSWKRQHRILVHRIEHG